MSFAVVPAGRSMLCIVMLIALFFVLFVIQLSSWLSWRLGLSCWYNRPLFYRNCHTNALLMHIHSIFYMLFSHHISSVCLNQLPEDWKARIQPRGRNLRRSIQSPRSSNWRDRCTQTHSPRSRRWRHPLHGPARDLAAPRIDPRKHRRSKRLRPRRWQALPRLRISRSGSQKGSRILQRPPGQNAREILPLPNDPRAGILSRPRRHASRFEAAESPGKPRRSPQTRRFWVGTCLLPPNPSVDARGGYAVVSPPRDTAGESDVRSSHGCLGYRHYLRGDGDQTSVVSRWFRDWWTLQNL